MTALPTPTSPPYLALHEPLSRLAPFNEVRFRDCMTYLAAMKTASLSQLTMVNLSLLIDLFHILRRGQPVIGGSVAAWELGPVIPEAYHLCDDWKAQHDRSGTHPLGLRVVAPSCRAVRFRAAGPVDLEDFSQLEAEAMEQAWGEIGHLNAPALRRYTHSPDTFLGHAYTAARAGNRLMDWAEIIDAYDRSRGEDHAAIKELIRF